MKALIVMDMLDDFVRPAPIGALYCGPTIDPIVALIKVRIRVAIADPDNWIVIYINDAHEPDDLEFLRFPKHAVRGTEGARIVSELLSEGPCILIDKTRYSGFYGTQLEEVLIKSNVSEVTIVGCCTSICVMDTVGGLANRDYDIIVPADEVADFDQEMHAMALKRMAALYGAEVV